MKNNTVKKWLFLLCLLPAFAFAEDALPDFPDLADSAWQILEVDKSYPGTPMLLVSSVTPDFSGETTRVKYIFNIRSPRGYDNVSAEIIDCKESSYRTLAFGDSAQRQWLPAPDVRQKIDTMTNSRDLARSMLLDTFCVQRFPKNATEIRRNLKNSF